MIAFYILLAILLLLYAGYKLARFNHDHDHLGMIKATFATCMAIYLIIESISLAVQISY